MLLFYRNTECSPNFSFPIRNDGLRSHHYFWVIMITNGWPYQIPMTFIGQYVCLCGLYFCWPYLVLCRNLWNFEQFSSKVYLAKRLPWYPLYDGYFVSKTWRFELYIIALLYIILRTSRLVLSLRHKSAAEQFTAVYHWDDGRNNPTL